MHQYIAGKRGPGGFPPPVMCDLCDKDEGTLWYWCEVAGWLFQNDMIPEQVLTNAMDLDIINTVLDLSRQQKFSPKVAAEILQSVGPDVCG